MAVSAVSAGGSSPVKSSSQSLAANFDTFLKLLTTQLQNQDPLAPMDANEFTSQLVEFASVEQAIQTNSKLGELGKLIESSGTTSAMGMLGREVTAATDRVGLAASGDAQIRYAATRGRGQDHGHRPGRARPRGAQPSRRHRAGREPGALGRPRRHRPARGPPAATRFASRRRGRTAPRSPPSSTSPAWSKGSSRVPTGSLSSSPGRKCR